MIRGTDISDFSSEFPACLYWTAELEPFSITFGPLPGGFHFEAGIADRTAVSPKCFIISLVSRIDGDIGGGFHLIDDEGVEFSDVISLVGKEEGISFETVISL